MARLLLASAGTMDGIKASISSYYCGTSFTLIPTGDNAWKIVRTSDGKELSGVSVARRRNRFRFEANL